MSVCKGWSGSWAGLGLGFDLSLQGKWLGKWSKSKLTWSKLSIDLWKLNKNQIQCSCMFLYIYIYIYTHTHTYINIYIYIYNLHNGECASVFNALLKTRRVSAFAFLRGLNMQLLQSPVQSVYIYIYTYVCLNSTRPLTLSMVYPQNNTCRMLRKKFVNLKLEASNLKLF